MTNVEALKAVYVALGGDTADVANALTIVNVLNAISDLLDGADDAITNPEAIANIAAVASGVAPKPTQDKTVAPKTTSQEVTADTGKVLSKVTVEAVTASIDANIVPGNIKSGVTILGVEGTYTGD
jgi:hypothetical protein